MGVSDFCMAPMTYTSNIVPRSIANVTEYYTTCVGTNPVTAPLSSTSQFVTSYTTSITALYNQPLLPACYHNSFLSASLYQLVVINTTSNAITSSATCAPTQSQLASLLHS